MIISIKLNEDKSMDLCDEWIETTFQELDLQETHIEEFLRKNIDLICGDDESMLVIGQQVVNCERGRSDLTAIDGEGRLVLIELKRDKKDIKSRSEPMEIQAIRYAASYASIKDIEEVSKKIYTPYIKEYIKEFKIGERTEEEFARKSINEFLQENNASKTFNYGQRIILVASDFDKQTLSAVSWLISNNVDISCIKITPMKYKDQYHLSIKKVLPVGELSDYYVDILEKNSKSINSRSQISERLMKTNLPRMAKLMEWDLISIGDTVHIKNHPNEKAVVLDANYVEYNGKKMTFNQWGKIITSWSSICIYEWIFVNDDTEILHAKRMKYIEEHSDEV